MTTVTVPKEFHAELPLPELPKLCPREIGVAGDFEVVGRNEGDPGPLDFIHRKTAEDEFYFVCSKSMDPQRLTCRFRVAAETNGQAPEFWWPDSGLRSACHDWKSVASGYTSYHLRLAIAPCRG